MFHPGENLARWRQPTDAPSQRLRQLAALLATVCAMAPAAASAQTAEQGQVLNEITVWDSATASPVAARASSGALGSASVLDTPYSVTVVSQADIQDRQANSLESVFARDASVTALGNTYSNFGDTITVRGLSLDYTDSFKINGLPISNFSGQLPLEVFQQVELLKGLTGFMYGFGSPGGIINYVTKKPTEQRTLSLAAGYRNQGIYSQHVDAGGRAGAGDWFGYRVNVVNEQGRLPYEDGRIDRQTLAASFDARLSPALTLTADLIKNSRLVKNPPAPYFSAWALAPTDPLPKPVGGRVNYGLRGAHEDHDNLIASVGAAWQVSPDWKARIDYSHTENRTRWIKTLADLTSASGDLDVNAYDQAFDVKYDSVQALLEGKLKTGSLSHEVVAGASTQKQRALRSDSTAVYDFIGTDNLYSHTPVDYGSYATPMAHRDMEKSFYVKQHALFISDRIRFTEQWALLAGLRHTRYKAADTWSGWDIYKKSINTPSLALLFNPRPDITLYTSYVKGLEEGATVDAPYANAPAKLPPLKSKQYEAGIKVDRRQWNATAAVFRIERGAEYANAANYYVQDGLERYDGLELNGQARVTSAVDLAASAMWLKATYEEADPAAGITGNRVEAAPRKQATFETGYTLPALPGLRLAAGWKHIGEQALDTANQWTLTSVNLYDVSANYRVPVGGKDLTLRAAITNLTNRKYWATEGWGGLRAGEPRAVALSAQLDF